MDLFEDLASDKTFAFAQSTLDQWTLQRDRGQWITEERTILLGLLTIALARSPGRWQVGQWRCYRRLAVDDLLEVGLCACNREPCYLYDVATTDRYCQSLWFQTGTV